jgi:hypothetical protein
VATLGTLEDPQTRQTYARHKIARLLHDWRTEVKNSKDRVLSHETLRSAAREWGKQFRKDKFNGINMDDLMMTGGKGGRTTKTNAGHHAMKPGAGDKYTSVMCSVDEN